MKLPNKKYKTILADPPWKYGKGFGYGAGEYYPLMELEEIKNLQIKSISNKNAHLYLWCPNSLVPQALEDIKKQKFTWWIIHSTEHPTGRKHIGYIAPTGKDKK